VYGRAGRVTAPKLGQKGTDAVDRASPEIDITRPHPARVYDYLLGGKDNFAVDRRAADAMTMQLPSLPTMTRANRHFLHRAVRHLVGELGVRQFLDIGSGIPTVCNVHQAAQEIAPDSRVVYVDNDPVVAAHSRALLSGVHPGSTAFVLADAADPAAVLADPVVAATLDLTEPVALMLVSVLMYFDDRTARTIIDTLLDALPPGSCLTVSHPTADFDPDVVDRAVAAAQRGGLTYRPRSAAEVHALFAGLDLVEPGVVPMLAWRPETTRGPRTDDRSVYYWAAMGRKPRPAARVDHEVSPRAGRH
jgi:O-methyltransferase involved in polyketide biosynthesis